MTTGKMNATEESAITTLFQGNSNNNRSSSARPTVKIQLDQVANPKTVTSQTNSLIQTIDEGDQSSSKSHKSIVYSSDQIDSITSKISIADSSSNITITTNDKTTVSSTVTSTSFSTSYSTGENDASDNDEITKNKGGIFNYVANLPISPSSSMNPGSSNSNVSNSSSQLLLRHPDAIPQLIQLLKHSTREVHEQAMWILGSIAAGEGATAPVPNPTNSSLTHFANANNMSIPNQIPSFANSTNSSSNSPPSVAQAREQVLQAGAMDAILACLEANPHVLRLQRIGSWTLSNLVNVQYQQPNTKNPSKSTIINGNGTNNASSNSNQNPDISIKTLLPTLKRLLYTADAEVLSHTCWALSHLCDGPSSYISKVVSPAGGLVPRLVELLLHPSWRVTKPALRTIGNVVCAECVDDTSHSGELLPSSFSSNGNSGPGGVMIPVDYTETILECGAVPRLKQLITHGNREIQKEACWTLSNIAAGAVDQIQAVIDSGAITPLVKLASDPNTDQEVRSEACWVVLNATSCGSDAQIETLVKEGCISVLGVLLGEQSMVMMALEGLERVLQVEEGKEMQRKKNDQCIPVSSMEPEATSVVSASLIEALEKHKNNAVSKRAVKIWKDHFVSCALCKQSFSRHRSNEAHFCNECKCHVCKNCDCTIYHLSYQEEFWAATEESAQAKSMAKKSKKNKKKQKKKKQKKQGNNSALLDSSQPSMKEKSTEVTESTGNSRANAEEDFGVRSRSSTVTSYSAGSGSGFDLNVSAQNHPPINDLAVLDEKQQLLKEPIELLRSNRKSLRLANVAETKMQGHNQGGSTSKNHKELRTKPRKSMNESNKPASPFESDDDGEYYSLSVSKSLNGQDDSTETKKEKDCSDIDLVHYLQQTGSIIALSRLLDQLDGDFSISNVKEKGDHLVNLDDVDREVNMQIIS